KKHYCPLCRRAFNRPSNLAIHMNIHTGVTPYVCTFPSCGRAFNVKANMQRHYRNTHGSTDDLEPTDVTRHRKSSSRSPRHYLSAQESSHSTGRSFPLVTPVQWSGDSRSSTPASTGQDCANVWLGGGSAGVAE
ncbi:hypothetical protein BDZ89DRAFT_953630, partial [Hymenopellis radicata]